MNTNISKFYAPYFKAWPVKQLGPRPSDQQLETAHAFGRPGKQSLAVAMSLRDGGVTGGQVVMVCHAPQNNHRIALVKAGLFKRDTSVPKADGLHTVYKLVLTPKGETAMKRRAEAEAKATLEGGEKAAKVKKAGKKARKARVATETPVIEPAVTAEPVAEGAMQGDSAQG